MSVQLRAVPDEVDAPGAPVLSVLQAVTEGSSKQVLVAMRARLAVAFDSPETPARDLAAMARRMTDLDDRIRAIELAEKEQAVEQDADTEDEAWEGV